MKLAKIVPIFKSGDTKIISNDRPISVLTIFSKNFEKAISKYLLELLDFINSLYKFQFGFAKNSFKLAMQLFRFYKKINNNNNNISLLQTHGPYTYKKNC